LNQTVKVPNIFRLAGAWGMYCWWRSSNQFYVSFNVVYVICSSDIYARLYWYPQDEDFATSNNWPVGWQNVAPYVSKLHARLPSTDVPSTDGKRYLTQVYDVFKGVLDAQGYQSITINGQRNKKDKIYGHSAFSVC
jgi:hypothetical protein